MPRELNFLLGLPTWSETAAFATTIRHVGALGDGHRLKLVNNFRSATPPSTRRRSRWQ